MTKEKLGKNFTIYIRAKVLISPKSRWLLKMVKKKTNKPGITTATKAKNINGVYRKSHVHYFITYEKMFNLIYNKRSEIFLYFYESGKILKVW